MNRLVLVLAIMVVPFAAFAEDAPASAPTDESPKVQMTMGDLSDSAFTNKGGTFVIHPITPSAISITDNLEVKTSLIGLIGGANVSLEYAVLQSPDMALSLEPGGSAGWGFNSYSGALQAHFSTRAGGSNFFSANAGGAYGYHGDLQSVDVNGNPIVIPAASSISVPVSLNYAIQSDPHTIWEIYAYTDALALATAPIKTGSVGFNWYHAFGGFRLGLGLDFLVGTIPQELINALKVVNVNLPPLAVFPLPDITLGWKF